jgi:rhodanese-related sulfurtransferase
MLVGEAKKNIRECSVQDVVARRQRGEGFVLIDVREDSEFARSRIPGADHIGRGVLERDIETQIPDKDADIVLYCGGGFRSALAADSLRKMGYRNVVSMDGGFRAWTSAGLPLDES